MKKKYLVLFVAFLLTYTSNAQFGAIDYSFGRPSPQLGDSSRFNGAGINVLLLQPDQKILVGGPFTTYNSVSRPRLVRLLNNGDLDPAFQTSSGFSSGEVQSLAVQNDGKIIVGGTFPSFNGQPRSGIVRLDSTGALDLGFTVGTGFNNGSNVYAICLQPDGKILVGGSFNTYDGTPAGRIVRLNTDGSLDTTFISGVGFDNSARSINFDNVTNSIYVGGNFSEYDNNTAANRLVRLSINGILDPTYDVGNGFSNTVYRTLLDNSGKLIVAGAFTSYDGQTLRRICRLMSDGSVDTSFLSGNGFDNIVYDLHFDANNNLLAAGDFAIYDTDTIGRLCRILPDGRLDHSFYTSSISTYNYTVDEIQSLDVQVDGSILIGGAFIEYNNTLRNKIARVKPDGWLETSFTTSWGVSNSHYIRDIKLQPDHKILLALDGNAIRYNGTAAPGIVRLLTNGDIDTSFHTPIGFKTNSTFTVKISCIVLDTINQKIYVGGDGTGFTTYDNVARKNLVRLNWDGSIDPNFNIGTGFNNGVKKILLQPDGKIIVVGNFTTFDGAAFNRIIRLDTLGIPDLSFISPSATNGFNAEANSVVLVPGGSGDMIIGGNFTTYNGVACEPLLRLHSDGTVENSFTPLGIVGINDLKFQTNGKIIACGAMSQRIIRLETDGSVDSSFINNIGTGADQKVNETEIQGNGKIILTGTFSSFDGTLANGIIRLNSDGTTDNTFNTGFGISDGYLTFNPGGHAIELQGYDDKMLIGGDYRTYDSIHVNGLVRLEGGPFTEVISLASQQSSAWIYPNPSSGRITVKMDIDYDSVRAAIFAIDGRLIQERVFIGENLFDIEIDSASGVYFLQLKTNSGTSIMKIIKN